MLVDQGWIEKLEPKGDEIFIMEQGNSYNLTKEGLEQL